MAGSDYSAVVFKIRTNGQVSLYPLEKFKKKMNIDFSKMEAYGEGLNKNNSVFYEKDAIKIGVVNTFLILFGYHVGEEFLQSKNTKLAMKFALEKVPLVNRNAFRVFLNKGEKREPFRER